jgi:hypothetical protein
MEDLFITMMPFLPTMNLADTLGLFSISGENGISISVEAIFGGQKDRLQYAVIYFNDTDLTADDFYPVCKFNYKSSSGLIYFRDEAVTIPAERLAKIKSVSILLFYVILPEEEM